MTLIIKNIKVGNNNISIDNTIYKNIPKDIIPNLFHNYVEFELHNSNCEFANAIRRVITAELPMKYMSVAISDINTNDKYIIADAFIKRLEMIPLNQSIDINTKFNLNLYNKTFTFNDILTNDITYINKSKKDKLYFDNLYRLGTLHSGKFITIDNIYIKYDTNYRSNYGKVEYKIINHDMDKFRSYNSNPSTFKLKIISNGQDDNPKDIIKVYIDFINNKLDNIYNIIKNNIEDSSIYTTSEFEVYKVFISEESYTIGYLISKYIFLIDNTIDYVAPRKDHPSKNDIIIDIKHSNAKDIFLQAINKIKDDLKILKQSFSA